MALPAEDKVPVSVTIIALDAASQIEACLASVAFADEIVVVDSGSTDGTIEIARRHGARVETRQWLGFGRQKQLAVSLARNDWGWKPEYVFDRAFDEYLLPTIRRRYA